MLGVGTVDSAPRVSILTDILRCRRLRLGVKRAMPRLLPPFTPALSTSQLRDLDRRAVEEFGIPSMVLMENAGRGACDVLVHQGQPRQVLVCCGRGNNAGDGLVMARHLDLRGIGVRVACWQAPQTWSGDTVRNYHIVQAAGIEVTNLSEDPSHQTFRDLLAHCDWVVDALLGTGTQGAPRPPLDGVIRALGSTTGPRILAVDIPSGLDADRGFPFDPVVRADVTVTFAASKRGFENPQSHEYLGDVYLADIGAPRALLESMWE